MNLRKTLSILGNPCRRLESDDPVPTSGDVSVPPGGQQWSSQLHSGGFEWLIAALLYDHIGNGAVIFARSGGVA
jgi:hypothetical protein